MAGYCAPCGGIPGRPCPACGGTGYRKPSRKISYQEARAAIRRAETKESNNER